jgi:hypothetical protein
MNGNRDAGLPLGPNFAERVLDAADRLVARRRLRRTAGASVLCVGFAAAAVWFDFSAAPKGPAQDRNPVFASAPSAQIDKEPVGSPAEPGSSADALSWFFPDAEPLARYAAEDPSDDRDTSAGALFADDE